MSALHTSGDELPGKIYAPVDMNCGMLSGDNSSVNSNKNKKECEKNQLYFDNDTVAISNDNCTIANSLSTLSYMIVLETHRMKLNFAT